MSAKSAAATKHEIVRVETETEFRTARENGDLVMGGIQDIFNHEWVCRCGDSLGSREEARRHEEEVSD